MVFEETVDLLLRIIRCIDSLPPPAKRTGWSEIWLSDGVEKTLARKRPLI